jgi:chloramphenicol 3-O phosphotransferase
MTGILNWVVQIIVLNGGSSSGKTEIARCLQSIIRACLKGLDVLWVGVHCDPVIAAGRELARGDRVTGMAALQADVVHQGVAYDIEVDTSRTQSLDCARLIAARVSVATLMS